MAARFTKGDSIASTNRTKTQNPTFNTKSTVKAGIPGYIKTSANASASGLTAGWPGAEGPKGAGPKREGDIAPGKAKSRAGWQGADKGGGSQDKHYKATSTGPAGSVRKLGEPKAPASRSRADSGKMESLKGRASSGKTRMY